MSTIKTETLSTPSNATVPVDTVVNGTAKAWVSFDGTGTVAIRRAFNVSTITDNGTGDYTVNFTTAMADANYATQISTWYGSDTLTTLVGGCGVKRGQAPTTSTVRVQVVNTVWNNAAGTDVSGIYVAIFS